MIRITNIHLPLNYDDNTLIKLVATTLKIDKRAIKSCSLFRRSVDARKKDNIYFLTSIDVELNQNEEKICKKCKNAEIVTPYSYEPPKWEGGATPLIVGMGPAGLFAGLILAQSGAKPIIIERGRDVDKRTEDVNTFWKTGILDTSSNVQFGEGGAGTFSDGKLNSGTKDIRQRKVFLEFVKHGADEEILYNAKPHIGTDKLKITIKNIRNEIIKLGGKVMFETKLLGINTIDEKVKSAIIETNGKQDIIETDSIILAIGHSARDTFEMLHEKNIAIEAKPFSVGARIEHLREKIDRSQYGSFANNKKLGSANYKMNVHLDNGRGVYTFCMCPGGKVVNASSEENMLVTNGMSEFARDDINSNSALLVGVYPDDFKGNHPLRGMHFQRELERKAFVLGGENYNAPVQRVCDFLSGQKTTSLGEVTPSIGPSYKPTNIADIFPDFISESMKLGIKAMGRKLNEFNNGDAVLTAVESRSSSPIRILRNSETLQSVSIKGLYPCGEGAGYAGGIISAAVDGIKCAEKVITKKRRDAAHNS